MDNVVTSAKVQELKRLIAMAVFEATEKPTRHKNPFAGEFDGWGAPTYHVDALCDVLKTTDAILVLGHLVSGEKA